MVSVNDPDARHTRKSPQARRDGYRAHVAAEPQTGSLTDEKLTRASGQDNANPAVAGEFVDRQAGRDTAMPAGPDARGGHGGPVAWYGDTAYGTGELRDAIGKAGHRAVIKPKPLQAPVEGGFTCPAGATRTIPPARHVVFGAACRTCPLRARCTTSKSGRALSLTRPVSKPGRQPATGPPGSYTDRTSTGRRRRAYEHEETPWHVTVSPPVLLGARKGLSKLSMH